MTSHLLALVCTRRPSVELHGATTIVIDKGVDSLGRVSNFLPHGWDVYVEVHLLKMPFLGYINQFAATSNAKQCTALTILFPLRWTSPKGGITC